MVRGGLAGGVGAARVVGGGFGEGGIAGFERAEHLVGGDVVEAEAAAGGLVQRGEPGAGGLEHDEGAGDVGVDEIARPVDRAVDMRFGGEMHHDVGPVRLEGGAHRRGIGDVGAEQMMARVRQRGTQRRLRRRIGHLVNRDDLVPRAPQKKPDNSRTNEAAAPGDQKFYIIHVIIFYLR